MISKGNKIVQKLETLFTFIDEENSVLCFNNIFIGLKS